MFPSVCEYFVHVECQDFAVADCKENATYLPGKDLSAVKHTHHWREGNLPSSSKCAVCKKSCFTAECLAGFRCEWCGMTVKERFIIRLPLPWFFAIHLFRFVSGIRTRLKYYIALLYLLISSQM